jgi:hypothetical protein
MRSIRIAVLATIAAGCSTAMAAGAANLPGWAGHLYADAVFFRYGGPVKIGSWAVAADVNKFPWPGGKPAGWSLAAYGQLQVDKAGDYLFQKEGNRAELWIGPEHVPLDGKSSITLPAGPAPVRLYAKCDQEQPQGNVDVRLQWKGPGMAAFSGLPVAAMSHTAGDEQRKVVYANWIPFGKPTTPIYNRRIFTVDVPCDGFYAYAGSTAGFGSHQAWLDGRQVYYYLNRYREGTVKRSGLFDEYRFVRYLTRGRHEFTLYAHDGPWPGADQMDAILAKVQLGLQLLGPESPESTLTVTLPDREDLVFKRQEPLKLRIEQVTDSAQAYRVKVRRQREDGAVIWTGQASLPANTPHAVADVSYPCDQEGAFEYTVVAADGKIVDGPWAFVVVDPTPLPPSVERGQNEAAPVLVDSVDCSAPTDPNHQFRDNGTSKVVETAGLRYRTTGTAAVRQRSYIKDKGVWRETKSGEKGEKSYPVFDWYAYTLHAKHPGKQHVLTAWIPNSSPRYVPVQVFDQVSGQYNAGSLWVGKSPVAGALSPLSVSVWPNGNIDVMVFGDGTQRGARYWNIDLAITEGAVARLELYEYPDGLPPLPQPADGWGQHKDFGMIGEQVDLGMEQRMMPKLWKDDQLFPPFLHPTWLWQDGYYDWKALRDTWERFGQLARWRGENLMSVPVFTYGSTRMINTPHFPQFDEAYTKGYRARDIDPLFRDQFKLMLLLAQKYGYRMVADVMVQIVCEQYLLDVAPEWKGRMDGVFLTNLKGGPVSTWVGAGAFNPAHPLARRYFLLMAEDIAKQYGKYPAFGGLRTRGWGDYPLGFDGWFSNLEMGYDDFTVNLFQKETGVQVPVKADDRNRFQVRHDWLLKNARAQWVKWRCDKTMSLREELLATVRKYAPQARLYGLTRYAEEIRGVDLEKAKARPELGWSGSKEFGGDSVEYNYLDPTEWKNFDLRLPPDRRPTLQQILETEGLLYPWGMCSGASDALRSYPYVLEEPAQVLAEQQLDTIHFGGGWVAPHVEPGLRRFIQAWRAIPNLNYSKVASPSRNTDAVVGWQAQDGRTLVFYLVNKTDRAQTVKVAFAGATAAVRDRVTGQTVGAGQHAEISVQPFMLKVLSAVGAGSIQKIEGPASAAPAVKGQPK